MTDSIVYADPAMYAGWPANHGAWQWGDEFLVGFLRGRYKSKSMHCIAEPFQKVLARSSDGGATWSVEEPGVDFECIAPTEPPRFDLADSIIRVCGVYDHGGNGCYEPGGFYLSHDRGACWSGPFTFDGLEQYLTGPMICTARTRVQDGLVFLSAGHRDMWGTDYVFCATHDGQRFNFRAVVCDDNARAVMPATARVGDRIVVALRRRKTAVREGWIDAFASDDEGKSMRFLSMVGVTGSMNGNPPALIALADGRLCCCYGNRDFGSMVCAVSADAGKSWDSTIMRAGSTDHKDIGYPQLFMRSDGVPVCVYYWADDQRPQQHIVATTMKQVLQ